MSPDDTKYENQVQDCSITVYVVSFSDTNKINKFWRKALEKEKGRKAAKKIMMMKMLQECLRM